MNPQYAGASEDRRTYVPGPAHPVVALRCQIEVDTRRALKKMVGTTGITP